MSNSITIRFTTEDPTEISAALRELSDKFTNDTTGLDEYFTYQSIYNRAETEVIGNIQLELE